MKVKAMKINGFGPTMDILDIEYGINDKVVWKWSDEKKIHKNIIYYTQSSGRAYFKNNGTRYYLDEFVRL